ncbi:ATP-binding protein [Methanobacterium formicicum]|uniref:ATP-binding protein n=1 Tax=Methanobacterium formicicum TaxID=2162 RepID=UPI002412B9BB|nr:ATP-binding protein [Methanobacterium formicicum]MDG3546573.1 ATP-binding protein [Methanobacterium formicicum]
MVDKRRGNFRLGPNFEDKFIKDMVSNPEITLIELVSNAWDARATEVHITWPIPKVVVHGDIFEIKDNGQGMTEDEFYDYWGELGFNKRNVFGSTLELKDGSQRQVQGRNGKGRLSLFALSDSYIVKTCKDNVKTVIKVKKQVDNKYGEFSTIRTETVNDEITGTSIKCNLNNCIKIDKVKNVLATRFGADPNFKIFINGEELKLLDLNQYQKNKYDFKGETIEIIRIPRDRYNKKLTQYQIAWWVNRKAVELNRWKDLNIPLSANNPDENKYVFNVVVNFLVEHVKTKGTGFNDSDEVKSVKEFVADKILELASDTLKISNHTTKINTIRLSKEALRNLNPITERDIGNFIEEAVIKTRIKPDELAKLIPIIKKLDRSTHRFDLLAKLATFTPNQMDKLNEILNKWNIEDIYTVLEELYWRLEVIAKLRILTEDPLIKEKEIHHLFDTGLWIFGPEYEGTANFVSNKTLKNTLSKVLNVQTKFEGDNKRPDIVVTPNDSIWDIYGQDKIKNGSIIGYKRILIIELKRAGVKIGFDEMSQALKYATAIKNHGKLQIDNKVICIVLGSNVDPDDTEPLEKGDRIVYPCTYETVLRNGEARTLNLIHRIRDVKGITDIGDPDINEVLHEENAQTHL